MKKSILTIMFLSVVLCLSAQTKYAVAKVVETIKKESSRITIVYETGKSEVINLSDLNFMSNTKLNECVLENVTTITTFLNNLSKMGYKLVAMNSESVNTNIIISTYIFSKE